LQTTQSGAIHVEKLVQTNIWTDFAMTLSFLSSLPLFQPSINIHKK